MKIEKMSGPALLRKLFKNASENGGIQYIYTLVRVTGYGEEPDQLVNLQQSINRLDIENKNSLAQICSEIVNCIDVYNLMINLIRCSAKEDYFSHPFIHLYSGTGLDKIRPNNPQWINELVNYSRLKGNIQFAHHLKNLYTKNLLNNYYDKANLEITDNDRKQLLALYTFIKKLLDIYFEERLKYNEHNKLYKCQGFEVLELLTDEELGLYGIKMYFSNGSYAHFERTKDSTICCNFSSLNPVNFMIGSIDDLKKEWIIKDKRLFEVGLPGRYNKLGEWKPIEFPAEVDGFVEEVKTFSDDPDCQGAYFYMICTGHKVIEFVMRTTLELPFDSITFGQRLHLWKCKSDELKGFNNYYHIYDGWVELEDCTIEAIKATLSGVGLLLNMIGLTYGAPIDWRLKYKMNEHIESNPTPSIEDFVFFDELMKKFPYKGNDARVLSYAVDWYVKGRTSKNIFVRFLSYYVALESVASAIVDGSTDTDFGLEFHKGSKSEIREKMLEDIIKLHDELFDQDPKKFVESAYFDFVKGLKKRTELIAGLVFGSKSHYLELLFKKTGPDNISLSDIRNKLAHGDIALFSSEEERLVQNHIYEIEEISKEFLIRIILQIKPDEKLPSWSEAYKSEFTTADPRSTLCCSKLDVLPVSNWNIRPEWFD